MKKVTSFELVHTIFSHEGEKASFEIKVSQVYQLADKLEPHNITCHLGVGSFMNLQDKFPNEVIIRRNSVELKDLSKLRKNLDNQLRFFKDDDLYNIIWTEWQKD